MKYIIPFINEHNWEHTDECTYCKQIDLLINEVIDYQQEIVNGNQNETTSLGNITDESITGELLKKINTIEEYLVDGYQILQCREAHGHILMNYDSIVDVHKMKNYEPSALNKYFKYLGEDNLLIYENVSENTSEDTSEDTSNESVSKVLVTADDTPTTLYSRWCSHCGARKPDIYDTTRRERYELIPLPITNFFVEFVKSSEDDRTIASIIWRDTPADSFAYSMIYDGDFPIITINERYKHEENPYYLGVIDNTLYQFYIVNYDKYGKELCRSETIYVIHEDNLTKPFIPPVTDTEADQEVRLLVDHTFKGITYSDSASGNDSNTNLPINVPNNIYERTEEGLIYNGIRYKRKNCIISSYTPTTKETIYRRAINGIPVDPFFGIECVFVQDIEDDDVNVWYIKPFPVSQEFAAKTATGYRLYKEYNYNSRCAVLPLTPLTKECENISLQNDSHKIYLKWENPVDIHYDKTIIIMKEYDGKPITKIADGKIIYETSTNNSFTIGNLHNGWYYQIGIFSVTKTGLVIVSENQVLGNPRYIRESIPWTIPYYLTHMDRFFWNEKEECITTIYPNTVGFLECEHPLVEGGILTLKVRSKAPVRLNIYTNEKNMFWMDISKHEILRWLPITIKLPRMDYCKFIFSVESSFGDATKFDMKDINFTYNDGEEDAESIEVINQRLEEERRKQQEDEERKQKEREENERRREGTEEQFLYQYQKKYYWYDSRPNIYRIPIR